MYKEKSERERSVRIEILPQSLCLIERGEGERGVEAHDIGDSRGREIL